MDTVKSGRAYIRERLTPVVGEQEVQQFVRLIFEHLRGYSWTELLLKGEEPLQPEECAFVEEVVARLQRHEPLQYVLGSTEFLGLQLDVGPGVLIPRPETEELVQWILEEQDERRLRLLEVGTGSGCIPIALKHAMPRWEVVAWDVSEIAIEQARGNARKNNVEVTFQMQDVLTYQAEKARWEVVVSNPPYVTHKEAALMAANVLQYEPHLALFVADHDPLLFYRCIAQVALQELVPGGRLYFEINEAYGAETTALLTSMGFVDVSLRKDLSGRDRMLRAQKP
ncbi:MAG TPA: peptide chain release factor N(5)-glutamine methyltransferase [Bacteroidales bacterium]|nr:peptide chain release factor N(5)-glutamine methyltransferase [Bacteroidales bacterium]